MAYALSEKNIATINKVLNERGSKSVEVRAGSNGVEIYRVTKERIQAHTQEIITRTRA